MKYFRNTLYCTLTAVLAVLFSACGNTGKAPAPQEYLKLQGFALGTSYSIIMETADTTGFMASLDSLFKVVDNSMSVYNPNSLLNRLNRNETDSVDVHIAYCIKTAAEISAMSDGEYDITVKPLTEAWGFTGADAVHKPNIDSLLQYVGYKKIKVENGKLIKEKPEIQMDLNSIAKGYTVDLTGRLIESRGIGNYLVEIGGEIFCKGVNREGKEWTIEIDTPFEGNIIPGRYRYDTISFSGKGMATSGNYRKFYTDKDGNKVVHSVNARTGESRPGNLLSATVIAENTTVADALGTLMMVTGLERSVELLKSRPDLMGYLIYIDDNGDYASYITPNLKPGSFGN